MTVTVTVPKGMALSKVLANGALSITEDCDAKLRSIGLDCDGLTESRGVAMSKDGKFGRIR